MKSIYYKIDPCPLGYILIAMTERGLCAIFLDDDPDFLVTELKNRFPAAKLNQANKEHEHLVSRVINLIETPGPCSDLPLDLQGSQFAQKVWRALQKVPVGSTASYKDIANKIGQPKSSRAVARACATNKLAVVIPCHRIVKSDGSLSGYRWGVARKRQLLTNEKVVIE